MRRKQPPIVNESYWMKRMFGSSLEGRVRSAAPIAATAKPSRRTVGVTSEAPLTADIAVGESSNAAIRGLGFDDGSELWAYSGHSDRIHSIRAGGDGHFYTGSQDESVAKLTIDGSEVWRTVVTSDNTAGIQEVDYTSNDDSVRAAKDRRVHNLDSNGNQVWDSAEMFDGLGTLMVTSDGITYCTPGINRIAKVDTDGTVLWERTFDDSVNNDLISGALLNNESAMALMGSGGNIFKFDLEANMIWKAELWQSVDGTPLDLEVDSSDNMYTAWNFPGTFVKQDTDGNTLWTNESITNDGDLRATAVDRNDLPYVSGNDPDLNGIAARITQEGSIEWNITSTSGYFESIGAY